MAGFVTWYGDEEQLGSMNVAPLAELDPWPDRLKGFRVGISSSGSSVIVVVVIHLRTSWAMQSPTPILKSTTLRLKGTQLVLQ